MLFGMRNSGQTFQQMMDMVIAIRQGVFCYLDILMLLSDEQSHSCHLLGLVAGVRFGTELQEVCVRPVTNGVLGPLNIVCGLATSGRQGSFCPVFLYTSQPQ
jgi:hypothetical protein